MLPLHGIPPTVFSSEQIVGAKRTECPELDSSDLKHNLHECPLWNTCCAELGL
jgi:hypothetical protein